MIAVIVLFGMAALLAGLGAAVRFGHAYFLISGYNTYTPEEKAHVNTRGLGREIWHMCLTLAALLMLAGALLLAGLTEGLLGLLFLILPVVGFFMWRAQKYNGNLCDETGHVTHEARVTVFAVLAVPTLIAVGAVALVFYSSRLPAVTLSSGEIAVSGMYHETIARSDIARVELLDRMPAVVYKRSGTDAGSRLMGDFVLKGGQAARLYVDTARPPFVRITEKNGSVTILTAGNAAKTRALYAALQTP